MDGIVAFIVWFTMFGCCFVCAGLRYVIVIFILLASLHPPLMLIGQVVEWSGVEWVALPCLPWSRP